VILLRPDLVDTFAVVSSIVVLGYGLAYAIGTWSGWSALTGSPANVQAPGYRPIS
jgi:hypothetical protein